MHANWLRNRLPEIRINGEIPIQLWDSKAQVKYSNLLEFDATGFVIIYRDDTISDKKFFPR